MKKRVYSLTDEDLIGMQNAISGVMRNVKETTPALLGTTASLITTLNNVDDILTILKNVVERGSIAIDIPDTQN